jgi:hypothetical protein
MTAKLNRLTETQAERRDSRRAQWRRYSASAKGRARRIRYECTDTALERKQRYDASPLDRERALRYRNQVNLMWSFSGGAGHRNHRTGDGTLIQPKTWGSDSSRRGLDEVTALRLRLLLGES